MPHANATTVQVTVDVMAAVLWSFQSPEQSAPATQQLRVRLQDEWNDVRVVAAEALGLLGETKAALRALAAVLANGNLYEALAAQNALDGLWQAGHIELDAALESVRGRSFPEPGDRIPRYWLEQARQRRG